MLPGFTEPGVKLQRQALEDFAAGLAGGGGAPAEQDLGDQGVHHGLAAAEPALGPVCLLQVASLAGHHGRDQPDRLGADVVDGGDLGE